MLLCLMILTGLTAGVQDHEGSTVNVTLSNTFLPKDTDGRQLQTGELQVFDNHNRDGYWYIYESDWGCCQQVDCCTNDQPWPYNDCWQCCPEQRSSPCTYNTNHTVQAYRTRDFADWENLGVLISTAERAAGTLFVPRVLYNEATSKYVMWFENYNASATPFKPNATQPRGEYSVALSDSPSKGFVVVKDRDNGSASFACGGSQGDFDLFLDDATGKGYIVNTYYSRMCIEELDSSFTGGTNKTAVIVTMDPTIPSHPPGDEAPTLFKRGAWYYLLYGSGCCGCKGGSISWMHRAKHPLGPWSKTGTLLSPNGPVSRAQPRTVFSVPTPGGGVQYIHLGNQWVPQNGGAGTCTNEGLLYWWPLEFTKDGNIVPLKEFKSTVSFELELEPELERGPELLAPTELTLLASPRD